MRLRIFYIVPVLAVLVSMFGAPVRAEFNLNDLGNSVNNAVNDATGGSAPSPADLVVDTIQFWTGTVPFAVSVKNQGGSPSIGATRIKVDWLRSNGTEQSTATYPCVPILSAGGTVACVPSLTIPTGVTRVRVTVNPSGSFATPESNINNNSKEVDIPAEPLPDLMVVSGSVNEDSRIATFTVKNAGNRSMSVVDLHAMGIRLLRLDSNGGTLEADQFVSLGAYCTSSLMLGLDPGMTFDCIAPMPLSNRVAKLRVFANQVKTAGVIRNPVRESNYNNNSLDIVVPAPKLPDLIVESITIDENTRIPLIKIKNQGTGTISLIASPFRIKKVFIDANGRALVMDELASAGLCNNVVASLVFAPGQTVDCVSTPLTNKVARFKVTANPAVAGIYPIQELNFTNNTLEVAAPAPKLPDLIVESISINPDTRIPTITIKNQGNAPVLLGALRMAIKVVLIDAAGKSLDVDKAFYSSLCPNVFAGLVFPEGTTKDCIATPLSNKVARMKVTVNPTAKDIAGKILDATFVEESNRANNTLEVVAPPPKFADLIVESISINEQTRIPTITIKNIGDAPAIAGALRMAMKVVLIDAAGKSLDVDKAFYSALCPNVFAGLVFPQGTTKECIATPLSYKVARMKVTVNPNPKDLLGKVFDAVLVEEKNRSNNTLEVAVPLPLIPDFLLENVTFTEGSNPILTVKNVGRADFSTGPLPFAVTVYGANGAELPLESLNVVGVPCNFAAPLAMGQTQDCRLDTQVTLAAKRMKVVLNAAKFGNGVRYTSDELSTSNNAKTVTIPVPPTPDLSLEAVTFTDGRNPILTLKNVGTRVQGSGPVVIAATVYDAAGRELAIESANVALAPCVLPASLDIGATVDCRLETQVTNAAKRLRVTLNAVRVGTGLRYLGGELSTTNNTRTGNAPLPKYPDFLLEAVTFTDGMNPVLTVKNIGQLSYGSGPLVFAATVYGASGQELPLESLNVIGAPCVFDGALQIGATRTCLLETQVTSGAKRLKITLNAMKTGATLRYVDQEVSTTNNTRTVDVPVARLPDLALTGIAVTEGRSPILTVKNVGTANYGTGPLVFAATVYDATGLELPLESANVFAAPCVFPAALVMGGTQDCLLSTQVTNNAKRIKVTLNAIKVGTGIQYLSGDLSNENNAFEAAIQEAPPAPEPAPVVRPTYYLEGPDSLQAEQQATYRAFHNQADGTVREMKDAIWSLGAGGVGGTLSQEGVYTAPYAAGHATIIYTFVDEGAFWTEAKKTILVEPMLTGIGQ